MLPTSHVLWTSVWLGIATDAVNRARAYLRSESRKDPGHVPAGALRLAEAVSALQTMRATLRDALQEYELAMEDADARRARYDELVATAYERGKAIQAGVSFQVDDVIDPADSRRFVASALDSIPPPLPREGKKRPFVDVW